MLHSLCIYLSFTVRTLHLILLSEYIKKSEMGRAHSTQKEINTKLGCGNVRKQSTLHIYVWIGV